MVAPTDSNAGPSAPANGAAADALMPKHDGHEQHAHDAEDDEEGSGSEGEGEEVAGEGAPGEAGKKKKKKNKKKKKSKASQSAQQSDLVHVVRENMTSEESKSVSDKDIQKVLKAVDLLKLFDMAGAQQGEPVIAEHKFWKTQPVPQKKESSSESTEGPIDPPKTVDEVKQEPYALPAGFEWSTIDVNDKDQLDEVHVLLTDNYVEDDDAMFRFRYSTEFLFWALAPPGYNPEWHIGVRVQKTGKLVAFISGVNFEIRCRASTFDSAEINFLCVHKKLRSKRLAPVLIKEVTRRVNLTNVWQAVYTAGVVLPTPFSSGRYFHRNLNPAKLVDIGFSPVPRGSTIARMVRNLAVPTAPSIPGLREMVAEDVPQVGELLRAFMSRYEIYQTFSKDTDIEHFFVSGRGKDVDGKREGQVVWSYVVEDPETHKITDFMSFYNLPSTIMQHPKHDVLKAAYMYYYATDAALKGDRSDPMTKDKTMRRLNELVEDILVMAKQNEFDVFNALSIMDNNSFLLAQKFGAGDGHLHYYLYNWSTAPIDGGLNTTQSRKPSELGIVML